VGNQFVFRKGVATEDAIFKVTNETLYTLNSKTMAGNIFIMELVVRLNYCLNFIFRKVIK